MQAFKLLTMLLRERLCTADSMRRPEPSAAMDDAAQVAAFHAQGAASLVPVYHFNALAASRLTPHGGTVVDLGSGSAQYLAYLARCRPDLHIIGIDLAPSMVAVGQNMLRGLELQAQVELREGDMTKFSEMIPDKVHLVSSVFSLHHLPSKELLSACLGQMALMRDRDQCALWIFDHVRPRHPSTPTVFPAIFTPQASSAFNQDSCNSLAASFTFGEMTCAIDKAGLADCQHLQSQWMRLYQVHTLMSSDDVDIQHAALWKGERLVGEAYRQWRGLQQLFPNLPGTA